MDQIEEHNSNNIFNSFEIPETYKHRASNFKTFFSFN